MAVLPQVQGEAHEAIVCYCECASTQVEDPLSSRNCGKISNTEGVTIVSFFFVGFADGIVAQAVLEPLSHVCDKVGPSLP